MQDRFDVEKIIQTMNSHMPRQRLSIEELLEEESPGYTTRDGSEVPISKEELSRLRAFVEDNEARRLRVPIYVSTDTASQSGAWRVDGRLESEVVARILGRKKHLEDSLRFYHPHLRELRKRFPSCFTVLYMP